MKKQASSECMKALLQSSQMFMLTFERGVSPLPGQPENIALSSTNRPLYTVLNKSSSVW